MDKLIVAQAKAKSNAVRVGLLKKAETIMRNDLAYLPVFYMEAGMAISKKYSFSNFDAIYSARNWANNIKKR